MDGTTEHMMDTILQWSFREWNLLFREANNGWQTTCVSGGGGLVCSLQFCSFASLGAREVSFLGPSLQTQQHGVFCSSASHIRLFLLHSFSFDLSPLLFYSLFYWKKGENPNYRF
jgi:hypothetical protein